MALVSVTRARLQATLTCVGTGLLWWHYRTSLTGTLAAIAGTLAALAWFLPSRYVPVQRTFDRVTHLLITGVSWFVLGIVYFGLFTPLRIWRAMLQRDPLELRPRPAADSYLNRVPARARARFDRQF